MSELLHVKVPIGIGAGIIAGGVLQRGALDAAGEIGHNPVGDGGGVVCRCGNLDCLETVASGAALVAALRSQGREVADVPGVVALVRAGDPEAVALVRHAGRRIGEVLAVAVNLLNPQVVVFGGDLAEAFEPLLAGVRELVYRRAMVPVTRELRIEQSALGQGAGQCRRVGRSGRISPARPRASAPVEPVFCVGRTNGRAAARSAGDSGDEHEQRDEGERDADGDAPAGASSAAGARSCRARSVGTGTATSAACRTRGACRALLPRVFRRRGGGRHPACSRARFPSGLWVGLVHAVVVPAVAPAGKGASWVAPAGEGAAGEGASWVAPAGEGASWVAASTARAKARHLSRSRLVCT